MYIFFNHYIMIFLPFFIEIVSFFFITILVSIYLFNIDLNINNDKFLIEFILLFLFFFSIIYSYICLVDIELCFYYDKLFVIETNNLFVKLFMLLQFTLLCILWPLNKLLSNIKVTLKLLILLLFSILGLCIAVNSRDLMLLYIGIDWLLYLYIY